MTAGSAFAESEAAATKLHQIFEEEWQHRLRIAPLLATAVGVHDYDDRLPSLTAESLAAGDSAIAGFISRLEKVDPEGLDPQDRVSRELLLRQLKDFRMEHAFGSHQIPLNADSGFHTGFAQTPDKMPFDSVKAYENYIARLAAWPRYVDGQIALMRQGMKRGFTLPRIVLEGIEGSISGHVVEEPEQSVFWAPFDRFPVSVPKKERERLREEGRTAILQSVVAGYRNFLTFMVETYVPAARETLGASELPDGEAYYRQQIRYYTTLDDMSADQIHQIGLAEVERIQKEMVEIIDSVGFEGDFQAFLNFLRTDPRFYAKTPEELLKQASWIAKRMDAQLPALFGRMPRRPYGVAPVPEAIAPKYTAGRYIGAPPGSTQPGWYWVNTHALESRPLYNLEALTLHEAVPGHHLQIELAKELEGLPPFRRSSYTSAFGEGWGLYSERLGLEAGFYKDPYSNFGRLTYEMWRACRLVIDTGVHAFGWSREKAFDYLAERTALSLHEVGTEIDRYISWPAQALSYKMGELKIRELRQRAETALGTRFDLRAFHDVVLEQGSIPLPVLEARVEEWIATSDSK